LCRLVVASSLVAPSSCLLITPHSRSLVVLSLRHPLVVSSRHLVVALPLVAPSSCPIVVLSLPTSLVAPATMVVVVVGVYTVMVCRWTDHILARNPLLEVEADLS